MSRASTIRNSPSVQTKSTARRKTAVAAVVALAVFVLGYIILAALVPPSVGISPGDSSREVPVDSQLKVSTSWMRGSVNSVKVKETMLDPAGNPTSQTDVKGHLEGNGFVRDDGSPLLKQDARYDVTVDASLIELTITGPKSREVTEHASFQTITTPAPLFSQDTQVVPSGEPIVVEFNTPIKSFTYELSPNLTSTSRIDDSNPTRAFIDFQGYEQGQKYKLTITSVDAQNGVQLKQPYSQTIATTDPLKVTFVPGDGESAVNTAERPTLTFSEDIKNQDQAQSLVSVDPAVPGSWNWVAPNKLEFKPQTDWAQGAKVTIHLKGGLDALRGVSGSYLREDVQSTFTTKPSKLIDVNLTEQRVYAYDNNQLVRTLICSSGSQATPSLTGTYTVYAKADKVNMSGPGYNAPNVPWVLMFNGDYTIHGNYWSTRFGVPTSHGCVGLPLDQAQWLYGWTPIGTVVQIHY